MAGKGLKSGKLKQIWLTNGASNLEELHNRSKQNILRRVKEDHLDLPPKIVSPYYLELENMKGYKTVFDEYLTWAESVGKHFNSGRHMIELIVLRKFIAMEKVSHSVELAQQAIDEGVDVLRRGELLVVPTETVYGLAADAGNDAAVRKIFSLKGRPADHPLIVHIADASKLPDWAIDVPDIAYRLAEQFWPGPLTLILKKHSRVSTAVTGGQDTIGLRCPDNPLTLALLHAFGGGVAAPSRPAFLASHREGPFSPRRSVAA